MKRHLHNFEDEETVREYELREVLRKDKACNNKVYYESRDKAKAAAMHYGQKYYKCHYCKGYHCTSS